jgi:hypothetical protein
MELFLFDPQQGPQMIPLSAGQLRFAPLPLQETQFILAINQLPVLSLFSGYLSYSGIILCPLPRDKKEKRTGDSYMFGKDAQSAVLLRLRRLISLFSLISQAEMAKYSGCDRKNVR